MMKIETAALHAGYTPSRGEPLPDPIIQSTTFPYATSEEMGKLFDLEASGYFYTRLQNPTNDYVAAKIAAMEGGAAGMLTSSGQAANFYSVFNIATCGDHVISSSSIYGGTFNLFAVTMKKMGIDFTFVSPDCTEEELIVAFKPNTKAVFGETIANPALTVLNIPLFAKCAHAHGVPLIIDNTFPTPVNCRPIEWGADIVTHSTTKYIDGHAATVGGAIVDAGKFDWMAHKDKFPGLTTPDEFYHGVVYAEKFGKEGAFITKCTAQLMRDFGSIQVLHNAEHLNLGLESLAVRMPRYAENAQKVAEFLEANEMVTWVNYPGLPSNKASVCQTTDADDLRRHLLRRQRRPEGGRDLHEEPETRLDRDPRRRRGQLRPPPRLLYPPPDERRGAGSGRRRFRPDPPVGRPRERRRHHRRPRPGPRRCKYNPLNGKTPCASPAHGVQTVEKQVWRKRWNRRWRWSYEETGEV